MAVVTSRRLRGSYLKQWVTAAKLKKGEHLKAPNGQVVTADEGTTLKDHDGWMWDLTIQDDHDFYVEPASDGTLYRVDPNGVSVAVGKGSSANFVVPVTLGAG
jgi:hypothetical protein